MLLLQQRMRGKSHQGIHRFPGCRKHCDAACDVRVLQGEGQVGSPFTIGAEAIGTLSNRFTVYKDPYFPRNKILVGYKGGSYLETGYVYAPFDIFGTRFQIEF